MASKAETILKRKLSTNHKCKLKPLFHRIPYEFFSLNFHEVFLLSLLKKKNGLLLRLFSISPLFLLCLFFILFSLSL
ncbi:hypothetical protein LguiB_033965 [Lonicera macranthoides]